MKAEHGPNFLTSSHLYQSAKQEFQKALGNLGIRPMAEVKVEPIKRREQKVTPFNAVARVLEVAGVIYGAIDAGYMLWTKANTGQTDELTTRLFQTVYDEVQAGLNNNKVVIPGVDGKDLTVTMTPAVPSMTPTETQTPTITPTATETQVPTPEKTFPVCKNEKYKDCVIYDGSSIPEAIKAIDQYRSWLETLSKPFDPATVKEVPMQVFQGPVNPLIVYDISTAPNFNDPATRPFRRNVTAGVVYIDYGGFKLPYVVKPIEYMDPNSPNPADPKNNKWVIAMDSYYGRDPISGGFMAIPDMDMWINTNISMWKNNMNTTPIAMGTLAQMTKAEDPLIRQVFDNNPDMPDRFQKFLGGDVSALSKSGIVVLTENYEGSSNFK